MRIGEVAARTGLSARVIRSYEARGWLRRTKIGAGHRQFDAAEVERLRTLRALLAAEVPPDLAARVADGRADDGECRAALHALTRLGEQVQAAVAAVHAEGASDAGPPEQHISLMFDTFLLRTRMESALTGALRPVGIPSGDYAIISLISIEGAMTPATVARLVGAAPSTLGGRLTGLARRGLIRRCPDAADRRSWRIELTAAGERALVDAMPYAHDLAVRIDAALHAGGARPEVIRAALITLSSALRGLLPGAEET